MLSEELDEEEDFVDYVEKSTVKIRKEKEREHLVEQVNALLPAFTMPSSDQAYGITSLEGGWTLA